MISISRGRVRHDANLRLSYHISCVGLRGGVTKTLRIGSKTEADGRTFEALLDAISTLLDNSKLSLSHM